MSLAIRSVAGKPRPNVSLYAATSLVGVGAYISGLVASAQIGDAGLADPLRGFSITVFVVVGVVREFIASSSR